jgi:hypothetical protein
MATTRKPPEGDPPGISPEDRAAFDTYVEELSQLGTPPKAEPGPTGPKPVTDAQWDAMTDRARESWVRQMVDSRLDDLSRDDEIARHAAEIEALKNKPEPEGTPAGQMPTMFQKLQKLLWGEPDQ